MKKSVIVSAILLVFCAVSVFSAPSKDLYVAVIMKSYSGDFWKTVELGAKTAGKDLGVKVTVEAPDTETNIEQQVKMVENAVIKGANVIAISVLDSKALIPAIEQARSAGVKILTFNSAIDSKIPLTHVATDNWAAGEMAGKALGEAMKGQGKFAILGAVQGVKNNRDRSDGAASYIAKKFPNMTLITIRYTDNDLNNALAITSDIITANPDIGGFFSNNETTTIAVSIVLGEKGKIGKIKHIGFDATAQTVGSLKSGITSSIVTQVPFKMGYIAVQSAVDANQGKTLPLVTDTGVALVTMDNLNTPEIQKILNPLK
ncbi:MAG: ABC transporter substrate-binding protein [Rectinemataceae bacterium]|nr:ABC transporter substrate-binding protein [Rectinemataceae bacterium]